MRRFCSRRTRPGSARNRPAGTCGAEPGNVQLHPGGATTFAVSCYDQHGQSYPCSDIEWSKDISALDEGNREYAQAADG